MNTAMYVHIPASLFQKFVIDALKKENPDTQKIIRFCEKCLLEHSTVEVEIEDE